MNYFGSALSGLWRGAGRLEQLIDYRLMAGSCSQPPTRQCCINHCPRLYIIDFHCHPVTVSTAHPPTPRRSSSFVIPTSRLKPIHSQPGTLAFKRQQITKCIAPRICLTSKGSIWTIKGNGKDCNGQCHLTITTGMIYPLVLKEN